MTTQSRTSTKYSQSVERDRFLSAVADHFPRVLEHLRLDALPSFAGLFEIRKVRTAGYGSEPSTSHGVTPDYHVEPPEQWAMLRVDKEQLDRLFADSKSFEWTWAGDFVDSNDPKRKALCSALVQWGKMFYLTEPWIYNMALDTLEWWITRPSWPTRWHGGRQWHKSSADSPPTLLINEEWGFEPWNGFEKRVQLQLDEYRAKIEQYYRDIGFDPDAAEHKYCHYEWLALFQVGRLSPEKIRQWHKKKYGKALDPSTFIKGYTATAHRIDLTLRTTDSRNRKSTARASFT